MNERAVRLCVVSAGASSAEAVAELLRARGLSVSWRHVPPEESPPPSLGQANDAVLILADLPERTQLRVARTYRFLPTAPRIIVINGSAAATEACIALGSA